MTADRLVFAGRVRLMGSGSAPLSKDVMDFLRICFGCTVIEGYGLTETTSCCSATYPEETRASHVGGVANTCELKLEDIPDMKYTNADVPNPRGEVISTFFNPSRLLISETRSGHGMWILLKGLGWYRLALSSKFAVLHRTNHKIHDLQFLVQYSEGASTAQSSISTHLSSCKNILALTADLCQRSASLHGLLQRWEKYIWSLRCQGVRIPVLLENLLAMLACMCAVLACLVLSYRKPAIYSSWILHTQDAKLPHRSGVMWYI